MFFAAAVYLMTLAIIRFADPDAVSLSLAAPLLHGLEIAGPYMFVIAAALVGTVGYGLLRLSNLARRAAIVIAFAGVVLLIPKVTAETGDFGWRFFSAALAVITRVMIVWYLWQSWTAEKFARR
jgi:hypothetical protein